MQSPRKFFIQMSGAPGAGKSTVANLLSQSIDGVVVNHDLLKSFFLGHGFSFVRSAELAYDLDWVVAEDIINQRRSVIIDSVCNHQPVLDNGMALARRYGYEYRYVWCQIGDFSLLDQRLRDRTPLRSQRTGLDSPPPDAGPVAAEQDHIALFKKWSEPRRPDKGFVIVVDSAQAPAESVGYILRELGRKIEVKNGDSD
ncbi:uncharacterized protein JN550_000524 [Neoarthrinium moseri]|uniref:uncharacterized protein n=1 Tax=Neoarthrinium moseri TaxID=1658444 RepID=UPI001FDC2D2E|nr:uncharacterized protein JN550_000524 [Neoarthrinium moseri]KAI1878342.1 hypothetical protein JN550_000524 [Neoarthrinium moseri]